MAGSVAGGAGAFYSWQNIPGEELFQTKEHQVPWFLGLAEHPRFLGYIPGDFECQTKESHPLGVLPITWSHWKRPLSHDRSTLYKQLVNATTHMGWECEWEGSHDSSRTLKRVARSCSSAPSGSFTRSPKFVSTKCLRRDLGCSDRDVLNAGANGGECHHPNTEK